VASPATGWWPESRWGGGARRQAHDAADREETMLPGLDPLLSADLLHALASAGHGDRIAIVDANFPAAGVARRLIPLHGATATAALVAVLSVLPVDTFEPDPVVVMQVVGDAEQTQEAVAEFTRVLGDAGVAPPARLAREDFYRAAREAYAVVLTGERRLYGNIMLTKGVVP
jgi:L-fucose mutarotase